MSATLLIDGAPATEGDLHYLALVNYGAYTSFRVEDGGVRGLDLHISRLEASAIELFGRPVGETRLRELIRTALDGRRETWLRISVFSPEIFARAPSSHVQPKVMTVVWPPPPPLAERMTLQVQMHERVAPHLKHVATFGLIRARRLAREAGFDDALFADADGVISEGVSWNIGFVQGETIIWPQAPMLVGVAQAVIQRGLAGVGLDQRTETVRAGDLDRFDGAFICNSATPACPITHIGNRVFLTDVAGIDRVRRAWEAGPVEAI